MNKQSQQYHKLQSDEEIELGDYTPESGSVLQGGSHTGEGAAAELLRNLQSNKYIKYVLYLLLFVCGIVLILLLISLLAMQLTGIGDNGSGSKKAVPASVSGAAHTVTVTSYITEATPSPESDTQKHRAVFLQVLKEEERRMKELEKQQAKAQEQLDQIKDIEQQVAQDQTDPNSNLLKILQSEEASIEQLQANIKQGMEQELDSTDKLMEIESEGLKMSPEQARKDKPRAELFAVIEEERKLLQEQRAELEGDISKSLDQVQQQVSRVKSQIMIQTQEISHDKTNGKPSDSNRVALLGILRQELKVLQAQEEKLTSKQEVSSNEADSDIADEIIGQTDKVIEDYKDGQN